jgi:hypothetical protein
VTVILGQDSERSWSGNGQSYPTNPADNGATPTWQPAAAQTGTGARTPAPTQQRSTPPPTSTPRPTRTPLCLPPTCIP